VVEDVVVADRVTQGSLRHAAAISDRPSTRADLRPVIACLSSSLPVGRHDSGRGPTNAGPPLGQAAALRTQVVARELPPQHLDRLEPVRPAAPTTQPSRWPIRRPRVESHNPEVAGSLSSFVATSRADGYGVPPTRSVPGGATLLSAQPLCVGSAPCSSGCAPLQVS
jgi:hypothetical protein